MAATRSRQDQQSAGHGHRCRQLVYREEQEVEGNRQQRDEQGSLQLPGAIGRYGEQAAKYPGNEQISISHDRRAEHLCLQAREPAHGVRCVECVVRRLQQVGDHECGVRTGHRHYPERKPARWRDASDQRAQGHTAERGEQHTGALANERTAICPCQDEQGRYEQRQSGSGVVRRPYQPAERERGEQRDRHERDVRERLGTAAFGQRANDHEPDDRERGYERPQTAVQTFRPRRRPCAWERNDEALAQ